MTSYNSRKSSDFLLCKIEKTKFLNAVDLEEIVDPLNSKELSLCGHYPLTSGRRDYRNIKIVFKLYLFCVADQNQVVRRARVTQ